MTNTTISAIHAYVQRIVAGGLKRSGTRNLCLKTRFAVYCSRVQLPFPLLTTVPTTPTSFHYHLATFQFTECDANTLQHGVGLLAETATRVTHDAVHQWRLPHLNGWARRPARTPKTPPHLTRIWRRPTPYIPRWHAGRLESCTPSKAQCWKLA